MKPKGLCNFAAIARRARNGYYTSPEEVEEEFNKAREALEFWAAEAISDFEKSNRCGHEWGPAYYYHKRMMLGDYFYEFNRVCTKCGRTDTFFDSAQEYSPENPPEGFDNPSSKYWNNTI